MVATHTSTQAAYFITQQSQAVPSCCWSRWRAVIESLYANGLTPLQLVESCGFSYAMVVRYALGLSSNGGAVSVFASDTFYGWVALAAARHLLHGGASVNIFTLPNCKHEGQGPMAHLLPPLVSDGASKITWEDPRKFGHVLATVEGSHNVLCGLSDANRSYLPWLESFVAFMNESAIPVHAVGTPLGLSPDGEALGVGFLYASSTLSLGLPLDVLNAHPEIIGRHYLCDLLWGLTHYHELGYRGDPLFAEQPVIRLSCCDG